MFRKFESTQNKKNNIASVTIKSLKNFNNNSLERLRQIVEIFNPENLYFIIDIYKAQKDMIIQRLKIIDQNSRCIVFQREGSCHIEYQSTINYMIEILQLMVKFDINEVYFFETKNLAFEQYVFDEKLMEKIYQSNITNAIFTVCSHDGFHYILFRTDKYDYNDTIYKINQILNK